VPAFIGFVLNQLPPPPCRVLEVGCGPEGGLVRALVEAGYDAIGIDPEAPEGERFVRGTFQDASSTLSQGWEAVVAGRVLHHVNPLEEGLDRLAELAPRLLVDEFARELIQEREQVWYEERYRLVVEAGAQAPGPPSLDAWRARHPDLHGHRVLLDALRARYEERTHEWIPYLHRWLGDPESESVEAEAVATGALRAVGWRWSGVRR
jgi:SAM-dependent methyltransferase